MSVITLSSFCLKLSKSPGLKTVKIQPESWFMWWQGIRHIK